MFPTLFEGTPRNDLRRQTLQLNTGSFLDARENNF